MKEGKKEKINNGVGYIKRNGAVFSLSTQKGDWSRQHDHIDPFYWGNITYRKDSTCIMNIRIYKKPTLKQLATLLLIDCKIICEYWIDNEFKDFGINVFGSKTVVNKLEQIYY